MKRLTIILFTLLINLAVSAQLKEVKKQFKEIQLPVDQSDIKDIKSIEPLSNNLKLSFAGSDEKVYPHFRFNVYKYFEAFVYTLVENSGSKKLMLRIYDNYENIISETELDYTPYGDLGFVINKNYLVQKVVLEQNHYGFWVSEGDDNCASYMSVDDPKEVITDKFTIDNGGEIQYFSKYLVMQKVEMFLNFFSDKNYTAAFYCQKNPNWGNIEHFKSTKGFGGINHVEIDSLAYISGNDKNAKVFCKATYYDNINGDADIEQFFTVSYTDGNWYITGMKVKKFQKRRNYIDEDYSFKDLTIKLSNLNKTGFDFKIEAVSNDECPDGYENLYVFVTGKAKYINSETAEYTKDNFSLKFTFINDGLKLSAKNYQNKYKNLNLLFNKTFKIRK